jgi:hypothetical protein
VHFRAQIGQKCTLFASESAKKGVFCRGEGRLFGRPKTGVFGHFRVARGDARGGRFRTEFEFKNRTEAPTLHSIRKYKKKYFLFFLYFRRLLHKKE